MSVLHKLRKIATFARYMKDFIQLLSPLIDKKGKAVVISHPNPDADAIGSSLAWVRFLQHCGWDAAYVSPNDCPQNLKWMHGSASVLSFEREKEKAGIQARVLEADAIFCLDFNTLSRLEKLGELVASSQAVKVMIDHHQQPEDFAALMFSNTKYGATAEMIFDVIDALGKTDLIDEHIADNLYTGLVSDTGFFQFSNTTPNVMKVGGALIARGVKPDVISGNINNVFRLRRLQFFGYCLSRKMRLVKNGKVAYITVNRSEIKRFGLQQGDSEGLVNYPFKIESVQMSVYFSEEPEKVKISFRSRGDVDVNLFARQYFEGGGHKNAAGGKSTLTLEETEERFLRLIDETSLFDSQQQTSIPID
jgi:phosphoesterase RecJ-like protein